MSKIEVIVRTHAHTHTHTHTTIALPGPRKWSAKLGFLLSVKLERATTKRCCHD